MTDSEVRRLSRSALLDLLIEETERNHQLEAKIDKLEKQLKSRSIAVSSAGSMADAAMELNRVFSSADKAAEQYLENIRAANQRCDEMIAQAKRQAAEIIAEAEAQAKELRGSSSRNRTVVEQATVPKPRTALDRENSKEAAVKNRSSRQQPSKRSGEQNVGISERKASPAQKKKDPVVDPFADAPLDDKLSKAFSEMQKRNRR